MIDDFFAVDGMTPVQWSDLARSHVRSGDKLLLLALLDSARTDLLRYRNAASMNGRRLYQDAWFWVCGAEVKDGFTFAQVCDGLELDTTRMSKGMRAMTTTPGHKVHPIRTVPNVRHLRIERRRSA